MKKENTIHDSTFYKNNKKIQSNLWKIYALALGLGLMTLAIKSLN